MGSCTRRHYLLSTCFLQMLTIIERQVFDFLGYMWAPILANFFHIIFVIFGFYGAYHFRVRYIIAYLIWNLIWIGWNSFLICFYMDVGILDKNSDVLNLGTGSVSWFEVNGYGCNPAFPINITSEDPYRPVRPERVEDCLIEYPIVEVIHSGLQCILSILAIIGAILIAYLFLDEDDQFDFMGGDAKSPQHTSVHPMYVSYSSIPTTASATMLSNKQYDNYANAINAEQKATSTNPYIKHNTKSTSSASLQSKNMSLNQSRKNSNNYNNFINRPDIKYTQVSTEQLVTNIDDSNDNFCLQTFKIDDSCTYVPFQKPVPIFHYETNVVYPVRDNSQLFNNSDNSFTTQQQQQQHHQQQQQNNAINHSISNPFIRQYRKPEHQPYPDLSPEVPEKYVMPYQYITRSPTPSRSSSRRRQDRSQVANFCDQIRDAPPGYNSEAIMARAKSHDRLSNRRQQMNKNNNPRPRSFCNNSNYYDTISENV